MSIGFNNLARKVVTGNKNWGAPESMKYKECVPTNDMSGRTITIDECIVVNKKKYDPSSKTTLKNSRGEDIYQPVVYVAFDGEFFFATKSSLLIGQLRMLTGKELVEYRDSSYEIPEVAGSRVSIGADKVKYRNGSYYDQLIFTDPTE